MRTEDVFKKILIKCLLSAGKARIMMCLEIKAIKHLPPLLEAGHGNEAITRPLPASSQPLGGGGRMCLAERAWCPEMPLPTSQRCLTSKHRSATATYTEFGCHKPNSDLAKQMTGLIPNAKEDNYDLTNSAPDSQAWQDISTHSNPKQNGDGSQVKQPDRSVRGGGAGSHLLAVVSVRKWQA